jgi:hypothetical protein
MGTWLLISKMETRVCIDKVLVTNGNAELGQDKAPSLGWVVS